mmetsp:Transcript_2299/g.6778  ORF Transcript_2299/g.6778 Transcript_2299/m.6778 type:complete len:657 (-) Transcript_2299:172-2142(-)
MHVLGMQSWRDLSLLQRLPWVCGSLHKGESGTWTLATMNEWHLYQEERMMEGIGRCHTMGRWVCYTFPCAFIFAASFDLDTIYSSIDGNKWLSVTLMFFPVFTLEAALFVIRLLAPRRPCLVGLAGQTFIFLAMLSCTVLLPCRMESALMRHRVFLVEMIPTSALFTFVIRLPFWAHLFVIQPTFLALWIGYHVHIDFLLPPTIVYGVSYAFLLLVMVLINGTESWESFCERRSLEKDRDQLLLLRTSLQNLPDLRSDSSVEQVIGMLSSDGEARISVSLGAGPSDPSCEEAVAGSMGTATACKRSGSETTTRYSSLGLCCERPLSLYETASLETRATKQDLDAGVTQAMAEQGHHGHYQSSTHCGMHVLTATLHAPACCSHYCPQTTAIGGGSFGRVYQAFDEGTGRPFAVKQAVLDSRAVESHQSCKVLMQELEVYKTLRHAHVIGYLGHSYIEGNLSIYLEYAPGGSMASYIQEFGALDGHLLQTATLGLTEGLSYLHTLSPRVVHRDVKCSNVLLDLDFRVMLADFGNATSDDTSTSLEVAGSIPWMAPEIILQQCHNWSAADVWSLGCTIIEMATAEVPWGSGTFDNRMHALYHIAMSDTAPPLPKSSTTTCLDFIRACVDRAATNRPSAPQLLEHEFVVDVKLHDTFTAF